MIPKSLTSPSRKRRCHQGHQAHRRSMADAFIEGRQGEDAGVKMISSEDGEPVDVSSDNIIEVKDVFTKCTTIPRKKLKP